MKFKVFRSSNWNDKPCENARKETLNIKKCSCQMIQSHWIVDINSLEELLDFQRSLNCEIIIEDVPGRPYPMIEIYDANRE